MVRSSPWGEHTDPARAKPAVSNINACFFQLVRWVLRGGALDWLMEPCQGRGNRHPGGLYQSFVRTRFSGDKGLPLLGERPSSRRLPELKGPLTSFRSKDRLNTFRSELSRNRAGHQIPATTLVDGHEFHPQNRPCPGACSQRSGNLRVAAIQWRYGHRPRGAVGGKPETSA